MGVGSSVGLMLSVRDCVCFSLRLLPSMIRHTGQRLITTTESAVLSKTAESLVTEHFG
jgi:hypothetical protein